MANDSDIIWIKLAFAVAATTRKNVAGGLFITGHLFICLHVPGVCQLRMQQENVYNSF